MSSPIQKAGLCPGAILNALLSVAFVVAAAAISASCAPMPVVPSGKTTAKSRWALSPKALQKPADAGHERRLREQDLNLAKNLQGRLLRLSLPSTVLKHAIQVWVYLPPDYADTEDTDKRYPVVYILHGAPGSVRDCFVAAGVHRVAEKLIVERRIQPMILVGWDAHGPKGVTDVANYLNRGDGSWQMEDFFVQELVPWVDSHFRSLRDVTGRGIIGFSAGGYGAVNMGLKYPALFGVVASHAGFFDPNDDSRNMLRILGHRGASWNANNPILRVRELPMGMRLHLYLDVGRNDGLLAEFKKFEAELQARHIDYEGHIFPGKHTWKYLHAHYFDSLRFANERFLEMQKTHLTKNLKIPNRRAG